MKIYFEDSWLYTPEESLNIDYIIDAGAGITWCEKKLDEIFKTKPEAAVYTNSVAALSNKYCWNRKLHAPELYIRVGRNRTFTRVDSLTDRELRAGHNLMHLYRNGEFNTEKD